MGVFENRKLRRTCGRRRGTVTGGFIKFYNEELHNFYSSPNIAKVEDEMGGTCSTHRRCEMHAF
jgi:hypothetical protein